MDSKQKLKIQRRVKRTRFNARKNNRGGGMILRVRSTSKHFYSYLLSEDGGKILISVSTLSKNVKSGLSHEIKSYNRDGVKLVGAFMGKEIQDLGVKKIVFDRNGKHYGLKVDLFCQEVRKFITF